MNPLLSIVGYAAILTWFTIMAAAMLQTGVRYVRTLVWGVSIYGIAVMVRALLAG